LEQAFARRADRPHARVGIAARLAGRGGPQGEPGRPPFLTPVRQEQQARPFLTLGERQGMPANK
jgi:hypothetical protein